MLRPLAPLTAVLLLLSIAPASGAVSPRRLTWDELHQLVGKHVSIALFDGGAVAGKILEIQSDALLVEVSKTTHPVAYPKGPMRVPRATLHVLELHGKGQKYRILGTTLGFFAGAAGGVAVAIGVQGGVLNDDHPRGAVGALIGVMAGATAAGYLVGNTADRHNTTIQIVQ